MCMCDSQLSQRGHVMVRSWCRRGVLPCRRCELTMPPRRRVDDAAAAATWSSWWCYRRGAMVILLLMTRRWFGIVSPRRLHIVAAAICPVAGRGDASPDRRGDRSPGRRRGDRSSGRRGHIINTHHDVSPLCYLYLVCAIFVVDIYGIFVPCISIYDLFVVLRKWHSI